MFGIDDLAIGAIASAAIGAGANFMGQSSANRQNERLSRENMRFNSAEAQRARDFSHSEADINRQWTGAQAERAMGFSHDESALSREWSAGQAQHLMDFNSAEAQKQREFENTMSSTSWQRGIADMKAAGINPMLAFSRGGASTPGGATASGAMPSTSAPSGLMGSSSAAGTSQASSGGMIPYQNVMSNVTASINSALDVYRAKADLEKLRQEVAESQMRAKLARANTAKVDIDARNNKTLYAGMRNQEKVEQSGFGSLMAYFSKALPAVSTATQLLGGVSKLFAPKRTWNFKTGEVYGTQR